MHDPLLAVEPDDRNTLQRPRLSVGSLTVFIATVLVIASALLLRPRDVGGALTAGENRSYLLILLTICVMGVIWRARSAGFALDATMASGSEFLAVASVFGLFFIGNVSLLAAAAVVAIAALVVALDDSDEARATSTSSQPGRHWLAAIATLWLGVSTIVALNIEPAARNLLIAGETACAGFWILWRPGTPRGQLVLIAALAIIGVELSMGMAFLNVSRFVEASLWIVAMAIVIASPALLRRGIVA